MDNSVDQKADSDLSYSENDINSTDEKDKGGGISDVEEFAKANYFKDEASDNGWSDALAQYDDSDGSGDQSTPDVSKDSGAQKGRLEDLSAQEDDPRDRSTQKNGTEDPGAQDDGTEDPGAQDDGSKEPGAQDDGTEDPGAQDDGSKEPGAQDDGSKEPGAQDNGTENPGTQDDGTEDPGAQDDGTEDPGAQDDGSENSDTQEDGSKDMSDSLENLDVQDYVDKTGYPLSHIVSAVQNCIDTLDLNVLQWTCLHDTANVVDTLIEKYNEICRNNRVAPTTDLYVSSSTKESIYKKRKVNATITHVWYTDPIRMKFAQRQLVILDDVSAMNIEPWTAPNVILVAITSQSNIDLPIYLGGDDECKYRMNTYDWEHVQNGALAPKPFFHFPVSSQFGSHVHPQTAQCSAARQRETVQASHLNKMQIHMIVNAMRLPQSEHMAVIVQYPSDDMKCSDKIQWLDWIRRHCCVDVRLYGFPPQRAVDEPIEDINVTCCMPMHYSKIYGRGKNDYMSRRGYNMALLYSMIPPGQHVRLVDVYPEHSIGPLII